jgi:mono/diheme cytochrome c family protein
LINKILCILLKNEKEVLAMPKWINWFIITIFLGYALAVSPVAAFAQGQQIFNDRCAMCHGQDGKGNGPAAASFSPAPADFTSPGFWQGNVGQKITNTIENGHGPMPAISLSSNQIKAVIAYITKSFKP